jgi:hypothetical protein
LSEHDEKAEEHVEDLDVPESESEDVKGGLQFQKVEFGKVRLGKHGPIAGKHNPGDMRLGDGSV